MPAHLIALHSNVLFEQFYYLQNNIPSATDWLRLKIA